MSQRPIYICVTPFFPSPTAWQGAYVLDQVKAIARNSNFEVVVFKPTTGRDRQKSYEVDGVTVHLFPTRQTPSYMFNGFFNDYNGRSFIKKVQELGIDLQRVKYVHTHTGPFAIYGLALRKIAPHIKVFVQHHDLDPFTVRNGKFAHWRPNARYRAKNSIHLFNEVDLHICISTPVRDSLLAFPRPRKAEIYQPYLRALEPVADLPSIAPRAVYVLYNGVDTGLFHRPSTPKSDGVFRIGCIANFQELKEHRTLVEAFNILIRKGYTDMRLSLLGTGPTRPAIKQYISDHGLTPYVEWPSEVQHNQLPAYYHTLDLFVLPSIFEGFGCVYTEAHACGVPFICCEDQGSAELVAPDQRSQWQVSPRNPQQLADRMEENYKSREEQVLVKDSEIFKVIISYLEYIQTLQ